MCSRKFVAPVLWGLALILTGCGVTHRVVRIDALKPQNDRGIYYRLPETVVTARVVVKRTDKSPGDIGELVLALEEERAEELESIRDVPDTFIERLRSAFSLRPHVTQDLQDGVLFRVAGAPYTRETIEEIVGKIPAPRTPPAFELAKGAAIDTRARPDNDAAFLVELKGDGLIERQIITELTANGLISTGSSGAKDRGLEYGVKTLEVGAAIAGKVIGFGSPNDPTPVRIETTLNKRDADRIAAALEQIAAIRGNIATVLTSIGGSHPNDTLNTQLAELRKQEAAALARFTKKKSSEWTAVFEYVPGEHTDQDKSPHELFTLYDLTGVSVPSEASNEENQNSRFVLRGKIPDTFTQQMHPAQVRGKENKSVEVRGELLLDGEPIQPPQDDRIQPDGKATGFVYRVPAQVRARITDSKSITHAGADLLVAQWGPLIALPSRPGGFDSTYNVEFYADTGALKKATLSTAPPDLGGAATSAGTAAGSVFDALSAQKQAEQSAETSRLDRLKRRLEILETEKKIRELELEAASENN